MKVALEELHTVVDEQRQEIDYLQDMLQHLTARHHANGKWLHFCSVLSSVCLSVTLCTVAKRHVVGVSNGTVG